MDFDRASQDLAQKSVKARMIVENGLNSCQEEEEELGLTAVNARGDKSTSTAQQCEDHPAVLLEYWCEEDCRLVCKDCLIFGDHKGHTAITEEKR